jgi:YD repeat-containing protein
VNKDSTQAPGPRRLPFIWKWILVAILVACAAFLAFYNPRPRSIQVELLPFTDSPPAWDGSYPFVTIKVINPETNPPKFETAISRIQPTLRHDAPVNEFQVDLHSGMFILRQTDLFVPATPPLSLTRTYRVWDFHGRAFGAGTNHPYDICPTGTRFPYTYMDLNLEDGRQIHFRRISKGTGYADAVFRHEETSSEFYGAQIAWNGDGWTLTFRGGRRFRFPEAYLAKNYAQGAPLEMQEADGRKTELRRDKKRNLQEAISPSGRKITFGYDDFDRITEAGDGSGNVRKYSYDSTGHLATVSDASHLLYRFEYSRLLHLEGYDPYLMTGITDGNWNVLLRNTYRDGSRVYEQKLANGDVYRYEYFLDKQNQVVESIVTLPDGSKRKFYFKQGMPTGEQ